MTMQRCPRCGFHAAMTVPEAASRLGTSDETIRNWIKNGRLPAETERIPGGKRYLIPATAVEALATA